MSSLPQPQERPPAWFSYSVLAVTLLALALRLAAVLTIPTQPVSDFWSLFTRAANLHDFGTYEAIPGRPDASFPPLYPILLSGSFAIPLDRLLTSKVLNAILV